MTNRDKARQLYYQLRNDYYFGGFNQRAYIQRVRRLAAQVHPDRDTAAWQYLKVIETRLDLELRFSTKQVQP